MDSIIVRKDLRDNIVVFKADSENKEKGTIMMWNGKHGAQFEEVSIPYYKSTTPIDDKAKVEELAKGYTSNFGIKELIVRQRLIKKGTDKEESAAEEAGKPFDKAKFKRDVLAAFAKALEAV